MLPRRPTSLPPGGAPAVICRVILALLHLTMVATAHAAQQTLSLNQSISRPYLTTGNSPALRFREAASIAPLLRRPVAGGPPIAATGPAATEVALANDKAAASTPPMPLGMPEPAVTEPLDQETKPDKPAPAASTTPSKPQPAPILPDDTRKKVQSQDFLPLFRFPNPEGSNGDVIVPVVPTPPSPGTLPPSSATYRQE